MFSEISRFSSLAILFISSFDEKISFLEVCIFKLIFLTGSIFNSLLKFLEDLIVQIIFSIFINDSSKTRFLLNSGHLSSASIFLDQNNSSFKTSLINGTNG
jgi:hypothetical protein